MCRNYLRSVVFIDFCLGYCLDNIRLMLPFFSTETYARVVFISFLFLFVHFAGELVFNVLVNQKRYLYTTLANYWS